MASSGEEEKLTTCQKLGNEWNNFRTFLFNREAKTVLGRTKESWAKIGLFYLIFYGFLAAFFSAMLAVFLTTVKRPEDGGSPKLTQFIKNQPGMTTVMKLDALKGFDSTSNGKAFIDSTMEFLNKYKNTSIYGGGECNPNNTNGIPEGGEPCYVPFEYYDVCSPNITNTTFGFKEKQPCVFVKINKVYGWVPKKTGDSNFLEVKCTCTKAIDKDCVTVYPKGFMLAGFPFRGKKDHQLPVIALKVNTTRTGASARIDCKLVGEGIEVSDTFIPARSFGTIRIENVYPSK